MANDPVFQQYRYFKDAAEFRALSEYADRVDATPDDFATMIGWYSLPQKARVQCSLKSCRTAHRDGFVVQLRDGRITNVGHICGGKAFGDAFRAGVKAIDAQREFEAVRVGLERYRQDLPQFEARFEALMSGPRGARSLTKVRNTLREMLPGHLGRELTRKAHRNEKGVYRAVLRSDAEVEIEKVQQPSLRGDALKYKEERVGFFVGLSLFSRDPEGMLDKNVDEPLRQLRAGAAAIGVMKLKKLHKSLESVLPGLLEAETALDEAWGFFQEANFALMEQMVSSESDRAKIRSARRLLLGSNVQFAA